MDTLMFGCVGKIIQRGVNHIIKCSFGYVRTLQNMDPPQYGFNEKMRPVDKPHGTRPSSPQQRLAVNMLLDTVVDSLVEAYILKYGMNIRKYFVCNIKFSSIT